MPHYKYEPQSVVENCNYKLQAYYESPIIIDRILHNNRPEHSHTSQKHQRLILNGRSKFPAVTDFTVKL
jgi:hypothetical protein